jgi:hypothetical protein
MSLFRGRGKDTIPQSVSDKLPQVGEAEKHYPYVESVRLNETIDVLDKQQATFMNECLKKGMDAETAIAAFRDAIQGGFYPSMLQARIRRNPSRDVIFLHGDIPDGFLQVGEKYDGRFYVQPPVSRPRDSKWPTAPDPQNPDAFWFEHFNVVQPGDVPTYGGGTDPRDVQLVHELRSLNDRIARMLIVSEAQHNPDGSDR